MAELTFATFRSLGCPQTVTAVASVACVAACRARVERRRVSMFLAQETKTSDSVVKKEGQVRAVRRWFLRAVRGKDASLAEANGVVADDNRPPARVVFVG